MEDILLDEIREVMFNEEFRAIIEEIFSPWMGAALRAFLPRTSFNRSKIALTVTPSPREFLNGRMKNPKRVLLLGAGGMGMAPLAFYLRGAGIQVEAYDDRFTEPLRTRLLGEGIEVLGEPIPRANPIA